jgi:hypothetical protein
MFSVNVEDSLLLVRFVIVREGLYGEGGHEDGIMFFKELFVFVLDGSLTVQYVEELYDRECRAVGLLVGSVQHNDGKEVTVVFHKSLRSKEEAAFADEDGARSFGFCGSSFDGFRGDFGDLGDRCGAQDKQAESLERFDRRRLEGVVGENVDSDSQVVG